MARRGDGLYQRGRTWRLDFYHEGKRHVVTIGKSISKTVAREIARVKRGAILRGEAGIGKKPKDIALKKAADLFLEWVGVNRRPNTLRFHGNTRAIPMTERLKEALVQHRFRSGKQDAEAHVFVSRSKKAFRSIRNIFRTLRHTFGSRLAMKGVDVRTIQELMGHRRIEMTVRYAHGCDEHKTQVLRAALVPPPISTDHFTPSFTPPALDAVSTGAAAVVSATA